MKRAQKWATATGVMFALGLTACGGGGDDDDDDGPAPGPGWTTPPAPTSPPPSGAVVNGIFRDAVIQGLDYDAGGSLIGKTGADGRFQYSQGGSVSFRVGGVSLGSNPGQPFMTPMTLLANTTNLNQQIDNRLRFLQMLDLDGNVENGIVISEAVRTAAMSWTPLDFSVSYSAFATAVQPMIAAANMADGVTHTLPSETVARAHFGRTFACAYSGLYRGTYTGNGDFGVWALVVYGSGQMFGGGYSTPDREGFELEKTSALALSIFPAFATGQVSTGAVFSGSFGNPESVSGTWSSMPAGSGSGTFTGARSGGSDTAVYRISGYKFPVGTALLVSFEIDSSNRVTGSIIDRDYMRTAEPVTLTGTLSGTSFTAVASGNQYTVTGTFNTAAPPTSLALTGTLRDNVKGRDINLNLSPLAGCRLN